MSECLTGVYHGPKFVAWHTDPVDAGRFDGTLLAIGFSSDDAISLVEEFPPDSGPQTESASEHDAPDCFVQLASAMPMPAGAQLRGFEVIGVEYGLSSVHSWLCHSYESDVMSALGIRTNRWGLLDSYAQASSVLAWMLDRPDDQAPEPVYWTVAAIAECSRGAIPSD